MKPFKEKLPLKKDFKINEKKKTSDTVVNIHKKEELEYLVTPSETETNDEDI